MAAAIGVQDEFQRKALLGAQMRMVAQKGEVAGRAAGNDGVSHRATFFGYMGGNFTLDSGGWVSIPFGVDIGGGKDVKVFGRAKMGIRINPTNWLFVGVYPFNPTYSYIDSQATALSRRNEWTFPTTLEVGFRF